MMVPGENITGGGGGVKKKKKKGGQQGWRDFSLKNL